MSQTFVIYIDENDNESFVKHIKSFILNQFVYADICISSDDNIIVSQDYSILSSFYLSFFQGNIIYTNIENYLNYKHAHKLAKKYVLVANSDELLKKNISKSSIMNATILTITDGEIHEI